jgi:hypothetical protein
MQLNAIAFKGLDLNIRTFCLSFFNVSHVIIEMHSQSYKYLVADLIAEVCLSYDVFLF